MVAKRPSTQKILSAGELGYPFVICDDSVPDGMVHLRQWGTHPVTNQDDRRVYVSRNTWQYINSSVEVEGAYADLIAHTRWVDGLMHDVYIGPGAAMTRP